LVVRFNLIHMVSFIIIDCCHHCICGTYVFPIALFWTAAGFSSSDDTFKLLTTVSRISYNCILSFDMLPFQFLPTMCSDFPGYQ
jgi:hypothetical protein